MPFTPSDLDVTLNKLVDIKSYWLAYSGGLDSTVLLHGMLQRPTEITLKAIHINHGLHVDAEHWAEHCRQICQTLNVELLVLTVNAKAHRGESQEEVARRARYSALAPYIQQNDCLLTAQHEDDQAETLLLQLLRGSGVDGLAAMPEITPFSGGHLIRPLLRKTRAELQYYAEEQGLRWVEDSSNQSLKYDRNYLRAQVLPLLKSRWPAFSRVLARNAQLQAEASELLAEQAQSDIQRISGKQQNTLNIPSLRSLSNPRRRNVLRYWLRSKSLRPPSLAQLTEIERLLETSSDASPLIKIENHEIRRYRDTLYGFTTQIKEIPSPQVWDLKQPLYIPILDRSLYPEEIPVALKRHLDNCQKVEIRYRQGGERIQLGGHPHHHSLKKLLQEKAVPPWLRDQLPLLYGDDELLAVLGLDPPLWSE